MPLPLTPSSDYLSSYLQKWQSSPQLENYRLQEKSLDLLFKNFCPDNSAIEHILLKVSALNDFYSTNIFDTYTVAKHIREMNIEGCQTASKIDHPTASNFDQGIRLISCAV